MVKLIIDVEVASNGSFVVTYYKNMPTSLQRLAGIQQEKEVLAFSNTKELAEWLAKAKRD